MTIKEFADLVLDGVHPVVEFRKGIEEIESYAEAGMRGRATGICDDPDGDVRIQVDFTEFEEFNKQFEMPNYYDKMGFPSLTAHEAGLYKPTDAYYFYPKEDAEKYFTVVEDASLKLYNMYKQEPRSISYVQWIEEMASAYLFALQLSVKD